MQKTNHLSYIRILFFLLMIAFIIQFVGMGASTSMAQESEIGENILINPSFETLNGDRAANWEAKDRWGSGLVEVTPEAARTGDHGIQIEIDNTEDIWLRQTVDVVGGKAYELSAWLKSNVYSNGYAKIKVEFYRDTTDAIGWRGQFEGEDLGTSYEDWTKVSTQVEMPSDANIAQVYIRLYGPGVTHYDDVSFHMIDHTPGIQLFTDRIFYYENMELGTLTGNIWPTDGIYEAKTISYQISSEHGGTPIINESGVPASENLHIEFDPRIMNLQEPYIVEVKLHAADGAVLFEESTKIYRWERPTSLREDGVLMVDGEPFFPRIGYHVPEEDYPLVNETINAVQGLRDSPDRYNHDRVRESLDEAHAHGLKVFLPVYPNLWDLEGPQGFDYVHEKVTQLKDHPALIGWMIYDEPNKYEDSIPTLVEDLAEIYRIIRSIDEENPTYMVVADPPSVPSLGRLTDIIVTDPYPLNVQPISLVRNHVQSAKNLFPEKPIYNVLQSFMLPDRPRYAYLPTIKELRNMAYQSILEGVQGLGYYAYDDPGWNLLESRLYPGMIEFSDKEIPYFSDIILNGSKMDTYRDENVQWGLWEVEDELFAAVVNLTENRQTATVPLPDSGYHVETIALENIQYPIYGNELTLDLPALSSTLVRLTSPASISDMQHLVQEFAAEGDILNETTARMLNLHLTAVDQFEKQGAAHKAVQHMESFKILLEHHVANEMISDQAYEALVQDTDEFIQRIVQSLVQMDVRTFHAELVKGERLSVQVDLQNAGTEMLEGLEVQIQWPEAFQLDPVNETVQTLESGESEELQFEVDVPQSISIGKHAFEVSVLFNKNGQDMQITREKRVDLLPIIEVEPITYELFANEGGDQNVTIRLINRAMGPTEVSLAAASEEDWTFTIENPVQLSAGQRLEVQGMLDIPDTMDDGEYVLTLYAYVGEEHIETVEIPVYLDRNLIKNSSFEDFSGDRANSWRSNENWTTGNVVTTDEAAKSGVRGVKMGTETTANYYLMQDKVPVQGGEHYELSAWLRSEIESGGRAMMKIEFYHESGTLKEVWSDAFGSYDDWEKVSLITDAPSEANAARVFIRIFGPGTAYYDDVSFRKLTD